MNKKFLFFIVFLIILVAVCGYLYININNIAINSDSSSGALNSSSQTSQTPIPSGRTIVYREQIAQESSGERSWPKERISRIVNEGQPEILAEVGTVGEFPSDMVLSPDKKFLLINLESKLQKLDLATKQLTDLFVPKRQVASVTFSPDAKKIFIWDQKYASDDMSYSAHSLDLATGQSSEILSGTVREYLFGRAWRLDNRIILMAARGESAGVYVLNFETKQLTETAGLEFGLLSESGMWMTTPYKSIDSPCNEFSASEISRQKIVDPVTNSEKAEMGNDTHALEVIAFAPNDTEILYSQHLPLKETDCDGTAQEQYYVMNLSSKAIRNAQSDEAVLAQWRPEYVPVAMEYNEKNQTTVLKSNGKILVDASHANVRLVAAYIQK